MTVNSVERNLMHNLLEGAYRGAGVGAGILSYVAGGVFLQNGLEAGNRYLGFEPKWPFFTGDCQLDQFRDLSLCTTPASQVPVVAIIATTVIGGALVGAIAKVAKTVFSSTSKVH